MLMKFRSVLGLGSCHQRSYWNLRSSCFGEARAELLPIHLTIWQILPDCTFHHKIGTFCPTFLIPCHLNFFVYQNRVPICPRFFLKMFFST